MLLIYITMKKLKFIFILILLSSCKKHMPDTGHYLGIFYGAYVDGNGNNISLQRKEDIFILETNKKNIELAACSGCNSFFLTKNKEKVNGTIKIAQTIGLNIVHIFDVINIEGEIKKNTNEMSGSFSYNYKILNSNNQTTENYLVVGEFQLIKN